MPSFLSAYYNGDPVGVITPDGEVRGLVGFVMGDRGISYMDDGYLSPLHTGNEAHHLDGEPQFDGWDIVLVEHRFRSLVTDDEILGWATAFRDQDPAEVRKETQARLRELRASR